MFRRTMYGGNVYQYTLRAVRDSSPEIGGRISSKRFFDGILNRRDWSNTKLY